MLHDGRESHPCGFRPDEKRNCRVLRMPEISRFLGIIIKMYLKEHNPPHFHAFYGEYDAVFSIDTGQMIQGDFPSKKAALVTAWAIIHQKELLRNWKDLLKGVEANKIEPLR